MTIFIFQSQWEPCLNDLTAGDPRAYSSSGEEPFPRMRAPQGAHPGGRHETCITCIFQCGLPHQAPQAIFFFLKFVSCPAGGRNCGNIYFLSSFFFCNKIYLFNYFCGGGGALDRKRLFFLGWPHQAWTKGQSSRTGDYQVLILSVRGQESRSDHGANNPPGHLAVTGTRL